MSRITPLTPPTVPTQPLSTESLQRERLMQQATTITFDPKEIRLSEAGQCGRRQTLRALGYVPTPPTLRDQAIFDTGHAMEERLLALWEDRFPGAVDRQIEVVSPFGVGHIDGYVTPIHHLIECKTTTEKNADRLPMSSHIAQVTLYLHYWGNTRNATAEIAYYIKDTGEIRSFPVSYDPLLARELIVGLMDVQAAISVIGEPLPIPDDFQATQYPCAWHTREGLHQCGFWAYCWGNQITLERQARDAVVHAPPLASDLRAYYQLHQKLAALNDQKALLDAERQSYEHTFEQVLTAHTAQVLRAGDYQVRRTPIRGRTTTDVPALVQAGLITADQLAPYQKTGADYARWTPRPITPPKASHSAKKGRA